MANLQKRRYSAPRNPNRLPPPPPRLHGPFPLASELNLGDEPGADEKNTQGSGTSKNGGRANWNHQRMVYLIGLLKEYDVPRYQADNAWKKEAWTSITDQFNLKFGTTYSVAQAKQKEQDMKKEYSIVKDLCAESGFDWDSDRKMVTAPDTVWESLGERRNKESLLRWRDKSFPYYDDLFPLYDGCYAQRRNCHGMDHYANKAHQPAVGMGSYSPPLHVPDLKIQSPALEESGTRDDETDWFGTNELDDICTHGNDPSFPDSVEAAHFTSQEALIPEQPTETRVMNSHPSSTAPQIADKK